MNLGELMRHLIRIGILSTQRPTDNTASDSSEIWTSTRSPLESQETTFEKLYSFANSRAPSRLLSTIFHSTSNIYGSRRNNFHPSTNSFVPSIENFDATASKNGRYITVTGMTVESEFTGEHKTTNTPTTVSGTYTTVSPGVTASESTTANSETYMTTNTRAPPTRVVTGITAFESTTETETANTPTYTDTTIFPYTSTETASTPTYTDTILPYTSTQNPPTEGPPPKFGFKGINNFFAENVIFIANNIIV